LTTSSEYRLPIGVTPLHYELTLTPDLEAFTFDGRAVIDATLERTSSIVLNSAELTFNGAAITLANGDVVQAKEISLDEKSERATVVFDRELQPGTAQLSMDYTGILNDQLRGFYRAGYMDPDGNQRYMAATHLEATDARRAFPCWDEPSIKATYGITLNVPSDLVALSNMPVDESKDLGNGVKAVRFAKTPKMSTYLVVLVVADMVSVKEKTKHGTTMGVWAVRGKEEQGRFALETSVKVLDYFNDYFKIPYPLPKMDHIAVPDFAAGAMENWGGITYRETALLFDPENSAAAARQRIAEVVAHEMAHMWFGDLVTMEWWDDLWLNESFASWVGDKAVGSVFPEWNMWTQFVAHDTQAGLGLDGLRNSHPIGVDVKDPAEISEIFDAISYSKGGSVLRMLEAFLGEETFREGLHDYLFAHQYANARKDDLWTALEKASGQPVTKVMAAWVDQTGYPVLETQARRDGEVHVDITQRRFLYDNLLGAGDDDTTLWPVPLSVMTGPTCQQASFLLEDRDVAFAATSVLRTEPDDWVKINAGQTGFFRVNYSSDEWEKLKGAVQRREMPAIDRLGLESDAYALMRAGMLPATTYLSLAEAFVGEDDATVWGSLSSSFGGLTALLRDQPYLPKVEAFAGEVYRDIVGVVGWEPAPGEGHLDALRRSTVLSQAGLYGKVKRRFEGYLSNPVSLSPDLRGLVYSLAAHQGDQGVYDQLWELERKADLQEEKMRLLGAVSRIRQPELLQETLRRSMTDDVRAQDAVSLVMMVAGNRHGRDLAWQFVKDNWAEFDRRYGDGGFMLMRLVGITGSFTSLDRAAEVEEFFKTHPAPAAQRTLQQSLERIRLNARWLELNAAPLAERFAN
jgi:puromycin-sensitive aminopeptidase